MLKKKNILIAIFSFFFCCSMFAGSVAIKNENVMQSPAFAEDITLPEEDADWDSPINSESDTWWFDGEATVTLAGSTWDTPLYLPSDKELTINIIGENVIETTEDCSIVYEGTSLTFTGTGNLSLTSAIRVFNFDSTAVADFSGLSVVNECGENVDLRSPISLSKIAIGTFVSGVSVDITGEDKETTYDGSFYNLSKMFTFDSTLANEAVYSIVEDGTTGAGNITGCMLEITKCGVFNIKISVEGTEHTQVLTVNRANLPVGTGEGQTQIVLKAYDKDGVEVPAQYSNGWDEGTFDYVSASVLNNIGGGEVSYGYWIVDDEAYKVGSDAQMSIGNYDDEYTLIVEIAETDLYSSVKIEKIFCIKSPIDCYIVDSLLEREYNELDDGIFDITYLYQIQERCLSSVEIISYKVTSDVLNESLILNNSSLEITSIKDGVNGDNYTIEVIIKAREDAPYSSTSFNVYLRLKKGIVSNFDIQFISKVYDGLPVEYEVTENVYDLNYTIEYYAGQTLLDDIPVEHGKYSAKIIISGNDVFKETIIYRDFTIGQTVIEIVWGEDDFTYNGEVQTISAHYINHEGQEVPLIVYTDKMFKGVQVDGVDYEYKAYVTFATTDDRYTLPDSTVNQHTYHIKPMELKVEVLNRTKAFGSSNPPVLDVKIVSGKVFVGDDKDVLWELNIAEDINAETSVGSYEIIATATNANPNYNVTFTNTAYLQVTNVILTTDMIQDWTWGEEPNEPYAESAIGEVQFFYYKGETQLSSVPTEPGEYRLIARVGENDQDSSWAEFEEVFIIDKIVVNAPEEDTNEYIYNGALQSYRVMDSDLENAVLYEIGTREFRDAGVHQVPLIIKDFDHYRWSNGQQTYYMNFEIKKKPVSKPEADNRVHKYNGNVITYALPSSEEYVISDNITQTNVGRYKVIVSLVDTNNTTWSDGTVDNIVYNFVINQGKIDNPIVKDVDGNALNTKDVTIVDVSGNGLNPELNLQIEIAKSGDGKIDKVKNQLLSVLSKYDKIFKVADVKLVQYGVSVQPENRITLKMLVPEELRSANFTLYHIHTNENGEEVVSEIEYSKIDKDGYITFQTDKLSSFAFVYEQSSLKTSIIIFSVLSGVMFILLIAQVVFFILKKKSKSKAKVLAATAPVFFVKSEVSATIALGCVFGVLLIANIVMLVLNILAYKSKKCEDKKTQTKQKSKPAETKKA